MKINKKSHKNNKLIILVILVILLAGVGLYWFLNKQSEDNNNQSNQQSSSKVSSKSNKSASTQNNTAKTEQKSESNTTTEGTVHEKEKNITPAYEGENVSNAESLSGSINYSAVAGDKLIIRTTINQVVGSGNCNLTLSNGSKTVTKTSNIAQNPSSSTCEGFDIPVSELSNGRWIISISISDGTRSGKLSGSAEI